MAQQMFAPISNQKVQKTNQSQSAAERFAPKTEQSTNSSVEDPIEILSKLKKMLDAGLIEESEYNAKKAEILERM